MLMLKRPITILGLLLLCWSVSACDRTEEAIVPSSEGVFSDPPTGVQPSIQEGEIQIRLAACEQERTSDSDSNLIKAETWKNIEPYQTLADISKIGTGRLFDAAGYGWKPGISYAIAKDGKAWYWGFQRQTNVDFPRLIEGLKHVDQISGNYALTTDGQVWRLNEDHPPAKIDAFKDIISIQYLDEMFDTLFIVRSDRTAWKMDGDSTKPEKLPFKNVQEIYGSSFSLFVLDQNGKLAYFDGRSGELKFNQAKYLEISDKVLRAAIGYDDHGLIETDKGEVYAFSPDDQMLQRIPWADGVRQMAIAGNDTYFIVKADGSVWGWGENRSGLLGYNQGGRAEEPVQIQGLTDIVDIQAGTDHAMALSQQGFVYSWGNNMTGQLGRVPILFEHWTEFGELAGIIQVATELERPYFVREDGTIWSLNDDRTAVKIEGPAQIRSLTGLNNLPVTLNKEGQVHVWLDSFQECKQLVLPFSIKNMIGGDQGLLLQSEDDHFFLVKFKFELTLQADRYRIQSIFPEKIERIQMDRNESSQVNSLYSNHYTFFALTQDGQVWYAEKTKDTFSQFKPVPGVDGIEELAPEYFVRYTADPASVWALDEDRRVHEITITPVISNGDIETIEVKASSVTEVDIQMISGRLRVTNDGQIFEHDWRSEPQPLPGPVRFISSSYSYAIEGPGSHYHLIVTDDHKLYVLGYHPLGSQFAVPEQVVTKVE